MPQQIKGINPKGSCKIVTRVAEQKSGPKQMAKSGSRQELSAHALLYSARLNGIGASAASSLMRQVGK